MTFPDEGERWPVKMLVPFNALDLKRRFRDWALTLMSRVTGDSVLDWNGENGERER